MDKMSTLTEVVDALQWFLEEYGDLPVMVSRNGEMNNIDSADWTYLKPWKSLPEMIVLEL